MPPIGPRIVVVGDDGAARNSRPVVRDHRDELSRQGEAVSRLAATIPTRKEAQASRQTGLIVAADLNGLVISLR
jgi:hypothetical protein